MYMFGIVIVVGVHALYRDIRVDLHVMYCDSDTFTFRIVIVVSVYVLYCDSIM